MFINVAKAFYQPGEEFPLVIPVEVPPEYSNDEFTFINGGKFTGIYKFDGDRIVLQGTFTAQLSGQCAKCLETTVQTVTAGIYEIFVREGYAGYADDDDVMMEIPKSEYTVFSGNVIDLSAIIHSAIILSVPQRLVCSEDCKGLCGVCGGNKNHVDCDCKIQPYKPESPLAAALAHLQHSPQEADDGSNDPDKHSDEKVKY